MFESLVPILKILHYVFIAFFLGGQIYYLVILQPASYSFFSINDQIRFLQNVLKKQNPILLFALCLVVLTGGFMITPLKGELGGNYFSAFGAKLMWKLAYFFGVFFVTAYQTLAVGFKIKFLQPENTGDDHRAKLAQVRRLMTITSLLNIFGMAYILHYMLYN